MNSKKKIEKYENALEIILFCIQHNPKVNLNELRKELKINKNLFTSLSKLGIIKNTGKRRDANYILLKQYTPELALEVLNYSNDISKNIKENIIEKHVGKIQDNKRKSLLQRFFDIINF
jgi:hypothetical protein